MVDMVVASVLRHIERLKAGGWRHFGPKIKFREKTFPSLRQTGEGFSLNLISDEMQEKYRKLLRSAAVNLAQSAAAAACATPLSSRRRASRIPRVIMYAVGQA